MALTNAALGNNDKKWLPKEAISINELYYKRQSRSVL